MDEKDIKQVRNNLTKNLINVQKRLFQRDYQVPDYEKDFQHIKELKEVLSQIEQLTRLDKNLQNELLGKEFHTTDAVGKVDAIKIPLYLYLDTLKIIVEDVLDSTADLSSEKQEISTTISLLRIKLASLKYSYVFSPKKNLSNEAKKSIVESKGNFYYKVKEAFNKKFVAIISMEGVEKLSNLKGATSKREVYAFKEDKDYIDDRVIIKEGECLIQLKKELAIYFVNGEIPQKNQNIESCLIDKKLNPSLKKSIFQCVTAITNRQFSYKSYEDLLNDLRICESYTKEEQPEEENNSHLFVRYKGTIKTEEEKKSITKQDLDEFESAREEQLLQDEQVRNGLFVQG